MELKDMLKKQLQTEKSTKAAGLNKYTFLVDHNAAKEEIRRAFESAYKVKVTKVNSLNVHPSDRYLARYRRHITGNRLKRVVLTLAKGENLDLLGEDKKKEAKK